MSKWILDQYTGTTLDYPTLGFRANPGAILDATAAPDGRWSLASNQAAAETVTRYTIGIVDPNYVAPGDGHVLTWSKSGNTYVPTAPATFLGSADADSAIATKINTAGSSTANALSASYVGVANGSGIDPTGTSDSHAGLMNYLTSRAGKVAIIPPGTYRLDAPIDGDQLPTDLSVICMPGVKFWAGTAMTAMFSLGTSTTRWTNRMFQGNRVLFDCNSLAETSLWIKSHLNCDVSGIDVLNANGNAVMFGTPDNDNANELRYRDIKVNRTPSITPPANAAGILLNRVFDSMGYNCVSVGSDISFRTIGDANKHFQMHGWGYAGKLPSIIFDDNGFNSEYTACKADSPKGSGGVGFRMRGLGWTLNGGEVFNGPDGQAGAVGIFSDNGYPSATIQGMRFNGTAAAPLQTDLSGCPLPNEYLTVTGTVHFNVTAPVLKELDAVRNLSAWGYVQPNGSQSGSKVFSGAGNPDTFINAEPGSYYLRSGSPAEPGKRIYVNTSSGAAGTTWDPLYTGPTTLYFTGAGTAAGATRTATFTIADRALPTYHMGRPYLLHLTARDTTNGTHYSALCQVVISSEAATSVTVASVDNKLGTAFGNGAATGTFGVSASVSTDGLTLTVNVKNNGANATQFGMKLVP